MQFKTRVIDLFMVFSTFYMDKLEEIRRHHWKERLKINKIAKFKSDTSLASEGIALQSCENLETFNGMVGGGGWGGGQVCAPHPIIKTSVKFQQITFKLDNTTNFRRSFHWCWKRIERTKLDFRCPICRSAIGQASCLICARRRQLTFPFCCLISLLCLWCWRIFFLCLW